jgi:arginyl-tRNA synthetase
MGGNPDQLEVLLVQFAVLYQGGEKVQMSTRSGEFVTLRELRHEVGNDAARFFYVMRRSEQHMDFDLDLAKSQTKDNPVYYVQYAHARICSLFAQIETKGFQYEQTTGLASLDQLTEPLEKALITQIARYPEVIDHAALQREPHQLIQYVRDLATDLHSYYDADNKRIRILVEDAQLRNARLCLIDATRQILRNALAVVGVNAPDKM